MSKLKKEAVGQYNYVAPTPIPEKGAKKKARHSYPDFYPHHDVTVEIVDPQNFALFNIKPPKMFDTSYFSDYRHPPAENFQALKPKAEANDSQFTAYVQSSQKAKTGEKQQSLKHSGKTAKLLSDEIQQPNRNVVKSAGNLGTRSEKAPTQQPPGLARAQSAETKQRPTRNDKVNEEFYRSLLKARSGSEWKRPPDVSYDVLNPDKPDPKRKTKPYGSQMELEQEKISNTFGERKRAPRPSTVGGSSIRQRGESSAATPLPTAIISPPLVTRTDKFGKPVSKSGSRCSTASGRSSTRNSQLMTGLENFQNRPLTSASSVSSVGDDYLLDTGRHMNEVLETIQEEEILDELQPSARISPKPRAVVSERKRRKPKLKKPTPPADLFTKKGPDPRFYASKKNLRTPNEMERFRKARGRAFMRNVEQAIPELDFRDHEMKYQPERQLLRDVRWKVRKDVKDVRDKNLHSLVDRFQKRHEIIKEESRTRLGDPTYIGRDPVSVYKLQEVTNQAREKQPDLGFNVSYPLHNRRRITPSLGSVQRARNLGSHAQIFNQPCAPPYWGPQKVDHSLYLPPMAQNI